MFLVFFTGDSEWKFAAIDREAELQMGIPKRSLGMSASRPTFAASDRTDHRSGNRFRFASHGVRHGHEAYVRRMAGTHEGWIKNNTATSR
jgi:hypothetical protein